VALTLFKFLNSDERDTVLQIGLLNAGWVEEKKT
jgi:hypothetical protein